MTEVEQFTALHSKMMNLEFRTTFLAFSLYVLKIRKVSLVSNSNLRFSVFLKLEPENKTNFLTLKQILCDLKIRTPK